MPILSEKTCGACWAFRIYGLSSNYQCMANDKFRETCQSLENRIRALKQHGKIDNTWFIDFIDDVIELLLEIQSSEFKENDPLEEKANV